MGKPRIKPRVRPPARPEPKKNPKPGPRRRIRPGRTQVVVPVPVMPVAPVAIVPVAPVAPAPTPGPRIAPGLTGRARAEALVVEAKRLARELARTFYSLGVVLRELAEPGMYKPLGYATFDEAVEARDITSRTTAYKVMSIAGTFRRPEAEELGIEKGYAVIRYASVVRPGEKVTAVLASDPLLRLRDKTARLSEASAKDVFEAIREQTHTKVPESYLKRVQKASRGISQRLENIDVRTARVKTVQRGSRVRVRVEIDGSEAEKFLSRLKR